ncbi:MAG: hypothetical protein AVDCRST_MAG93-9460 [uncultured Chloroflexia bacterium]|uniref:Uncharacterized protein n=1 Tax=uncultured Chloroflexia bacterium TaxID=1672391 RepID=A0A6J4NER8_9CHLR|nr:MAG: hypothetical protein AVDCRST_MAG93-9460 [uncultured Chloroflexia bacterium]
MSILGLAHQQVEILDKVIKVLNMGAHTGTFAMSAMIQRPHHITMLIKRSNHMRVATGVLAIPMHQHDHTSECCLSFPDRIGEFDIAGSEECAFHGNSFLDHRPPTTDHRRRVYQPTTNDQRPMETNEKAEGGGRAAAENDF